VASHVAGKAAAHHSHANDADLSRVCFLCRLLVRFRGRRTSLVRVVRRDFGSAAARWSLLCSSSVRGRSSAASVP
jgi:hypothetical protein